MNNFEKITVAGRKILKRPAGDSASSKGTLILLHGYGADEYDLMGLAPYFDANLHILSIRAPRNAMNGGGAWFDIDMNVDGSLRLNADQARESADGIVSLIHELQSQGIVEDKKVILGGFSQGGSISQLVTLREPDLIRALLIMSGRLMEDASEKITDHKKFLNLPVFAGHGAHDNIIPVEFGRIIFSYWEALGTILEHYEYPMGHEISQDELGHIQNWMNTQVLNTQGQ